MAPKSKPISITVQALNIEMMYPETKVSNRLDSELTWIHKISPSPMGETYKIKLVYHLTETPKLYVLGPKPLPLAKGKTKLEHCYDQKQQRLCLYYPKHYEWHNTMLLTQTIIPWAYDWLYHYEIWLGTGEWTGGGIHLPTDKKKS